MKEDFIINKNDRILITGANGFIGTRVVRTMLQYGFENLICLTRPSGRDNGLEDILEASGVNSARIIRGNLLSREDCKLITEDVSVIYHLAAGTSQKSYSDAFLNSVVTTRNLLEAAAQWCSLKRFVNVSSFSVYTNARMKRGQLLDETCEMDGNPERRGEAYCYAKVKQDELVIEFCSARAISYVLMRPGTVFGPGKKGLPGRIGVATFGVFLHLGGSNRIPFTYVDNCAEAIVLAGLKKGVDGEIFNVVDDELPTSRQFLNMYKKQVRSFRSIPIARPVGYLLCYLWEKYSNWSQGQLPPIFNVGRWSNDWKGNRYSNEKLKKMLSWTPRVSFHEASRRFFDSERRS
jgi:nucleoside-diphosphate-sugar epimerase